MSQSFSDVSDPTDFPAGGLRDMDSSLRCDICRDFFDGPVTLHCGHGFCSYCIRTYLPAKPECPICRKPANEMGLRTNAALERAVAAWKLSRPLVLRLSIDEQLRLKQPQEVASSSKKKRKRSQNESSDAEAGPSKLARATSIHPDNDGDDIQIIERPGGTMPFTKPRGFPSKNLVDCPICSKQVELTLINAHMDNGCATAVQAPSSKMKITANETRKPTLKASPQKSKPPKVTKNAWSELMNGNGGGKGKGRERASSADGDEAPERIPKATYATLKDKQLKDMLSEHKLSTTGKRKELELRHERWVILYNANTDRTLRKTDGELRNELRRWEDDSNYKKKLVDPVAHQKKHKSDFQNLVEAARPKKNFSATSLDEDGECHKNAPSTIDKSASGTDGDTAPSSPTPSSRTRAAALVSCKEEEESSQVGMVVDE